MSLPCACLRLFVPQHGPGNGNIRLQELKCPSLCLAVPGCAECACVYLGVRLIGPCSTNVGRAIVHHHIKLVALGLMLQG